MGSLKSPRTTSYVVIEIKAVNCLVFEKIAFFLHFGDQQTGRQTDRQTNEQMDSIGALCRSGCGERRLNNPS